MARIAPRKTKADIATPQNNTGDLRSAAIIKVKPDGTLDFSSPSLSSFELNPSSYDENIAGGWKAQPTPGQSHPVYGWVSGGPRIVSFEALVTKDNIHLGQNEGSVAESLVGAAINVVGDIASAFSGITLPPITDLFSASGPEAGTQLAINDKLGYYRSLMYPSYTEDHKSLAGSAPLVVIVAGRTLSEAVAGNQAITGAKVGGPYLPLWAVQNVNIRITKQLPNLDPMEATVSFTLEEYVINPISQANHIATDIPPEASGGGLFDTLSNGLGGLF